MPHYSTYCGDSLNEYFFTVFTERYESLGDDEKDEKESMRNILTGVDIWHNLEIFIIETIENGETISKNLLSAILGSIDYNQFEKDLVEWLQNLEAEEDDSICNDCEDGSATYICYSCKYCKIIEY